MDNDEDEDIVQQLIQWQEMITYKYLEVKEKEKEESREGQLERNEELYIIYNQSLYFE